MRYRTAAEVYKKAIDSAKLEFMTHSLPAMLINNPKQFWNIINKKTQSTITLKTANGDCIASDECLNLLNSTFADSFSTDSMHDFPSLESADYLPMDPLFLDYVGAVRIIDKLKLSSSAGVDGINSKFLKNTKQYSSIILTKLFEQSIQDAVLPSDWKVGKVVPIHKAGDKHSPLNYRPISITSIPCKLLEHIIFSHLVNFLESNNFFNNAQHGFRKTFSCETQLISFTNDLHHILDRGSQADCIFLDFAKAFDKVSHNLLLLKLSKLNIDNNVLAWIQSFLTQRSQFVTVNNSNSSFVKVASGVPQGTVLGPLLFLIYINDLPTYVSSSVSLFADDCVLYREILDHNDTCILQSDINAINCWSDSWSMKLNTNKCKVMRVSRQSHECPNYFLNNAHLEPVSSYKYLGVHIASNLSWKTHIQHISANANRMLGYIKRNFSLAPVSLKLTLYKVLIRPKLEYAASVWDPGLVTLVSTLEAVQNRSARFILTNYHRTASVTSMKTTLSLPPLSLRRKISRLSLFHKMYHHNSFLRDKIIARPVYVSSRIDHQHKVGIPNSITTTFYSSFVPRTSQEWNHLPRSIAIITDSELFKTTITNYFITECV